MVMRYTISLKTRTRRLLEQSSYQMMTKVKTRHLLNRYNKQQTIYHHQKRVLLYAE